MKANPVNGIERDIFNAGLSVGALFAICVIGALGAVFIARNLVTFHE